ncbi:MAG: transposase [Candidatus Methylomirabilis oxyfera]|nr:transposase [Candidatus Methylomirabilis oxyfera]
MMPQAGSPQAKGRIERLWGTFQDRLVSELQLAGTTTLAEAQAVLTRFLLFYNRRFAKAATDAVPAWRAVEVHVLPDGSVEIFLQYDRLARFDAHTARTVGVYRQNERREVVSYGPDTTTTVQPYASAP